MSIVVLEDLAPPGYSSQKRIVEKVAADLEVHLKLKARKISITALWNECPPGEAGNEGLHTYLKDCGASTFLYANYHSAADFRDEYFCKFQRKPYVSPFVRWRW